MFTSASEVFLFQNVYSKWTLLLRSCASKPVSSSEERSGLRLALPGWLAVRPGWSTSAVPLRAVRATVAGVKVTRPCVAPGCTPLAPYAARKRNWLSHEYCGKNDSSDAIHDRLRSCAAEPLSTSEGSSG